MQIYLDGVTKRKKRQLQHAEQHVGQEISQRKHLQRVEQRAEQETNRKKHLQRAVRPVEREIGNLLPELHQKCAPEKGKKLGAYFPEDSKECILKNATHTIAEGE